MSEPRPTIHLICNAHLDPVWLWPWEDGLTEALSTFRVACDFCDDVPGFIFCHNEAVLYQWVEENDPVLFNRIRRLVKAGRWHISGGGLIQPDVNVPSGESHIRQYLVGKGYFRETFGVEPTTAYNFDSFGHAEGFAQILAGCGFDSYVFTRPHAFQWKLPDGAFRWRDRSGAEVMAWRSAISYLTRYDADVKLTKTLEPLADAPHVLFLWGIGNHGGGPARDDYAHIERFAKEHPEVELIHSTPEHFFKSVRATRDAMPVVTGEMQNVFPGCYTSMSRVKRGHRDCEGLIAAVERMAAMAWWLGRTPYPADELKTAWKDILFTEFHDILPGSCVPDAEKDALTGLGRCTEILRRLRVKLFLKLLQEEPACEAGVTPIFVFNPHAFRTDTTVECDFHHDSVPAKLGELELDVRDAVTGKKVAFQYERPATPLAYDWRIKLALRLTLEPFAVRRLEVSWRKRKEPQPFKTPALAKHLTYEGKDYRVVINRRTGLVDFAGPAGAEESWLKKGALQPIAWDDMENAWTCGDPALFPGQRSEGFVQSPPPWRAQRGVFRLASREETAKIVSPPSLRWGKKKSTGMAPLRVIETGPVRTILEAVFVMESSVVIRRYVMEQDGFEVRDRIFWNERDAILKVAVPMAFKPTNTVSETPYSAVVRPVPRSHSEHVNQRWVAATEANTGGKFVAVLNTGSNAHSVAKNTLHLSILRSPVHASMNMDPKIDMHEGRYWPRHDQGEHETSFRFVFGEGFDEEAVSREADCLNMRPQWLVHYPWREGSKRGAVTRAATFVTVDAKNVRLVAAKKAEKGNGLVLRLREMAGRDTDVALKVSGVTKPVRAHVAAYGLKTLILRRRGGECSVTETNLIERPV